MQLWNKHFAKRSTHFTIIFTKNVLMAIELQAFGACTSDR